MQLEFSNVYVIFIFQSMDSNKNTPTLPTIKFKEWKRKKKKG
jgi:hypothetical protein